jgi:hypothetical protein
MGTYAFAAALALALALPGAALAQSGHVEAGYANQTYDFGGPEFDTDIVSIGGQAAFTGMPVGVQVDARYANWGGDVDDVDAWQVGAHVFKRTERWLIGGYVGYDQIDDFNIEAWTGALEAQFYMPRSTLTGVLSYSEWQDVGYAVTMIEGEYRYFVTDNFSVHGGLGFGQGDISTSEPDVWEAQLGAEYQFAGAPVSIFGSYRHSTMDFSPGEIDVDTLSVGVRYNWGGSLMERNRNGAGLNRVTPIFDRFMS